MNEFMFELLVAGQIMAAQIYSEVLTYDLQQLSAMSMKENCAVSLTSQILTRCQNSSIHLT